MTNEQKAELRQLMSEGDPRGNAAIALEVDCSTGTVAKYRKAFAPKYRKFTVEYDGGCFAEFWALQSGSLLKEDTFDHYANQCFGLRKSMSMFRVAKIEEEQLPRPWRDLPGAAVVLKHSGDVIVWNAGGDKIKSEWD